MLTLTIYENANHRLVDNGKLTDYYYRAKAIIDTGIYHWQFFYTQKEIDDFLSATGMRVELIRETRGGSICSRHWAYNIKDKIHARYVMSLEGIHPDSVPVILTDNGDRVKCYTHRDGNHIYIDIPNPNAKGIREVVECASPFDGCESEFEKRLI